MSDSAGKLPLMCAGAQTLIRLAFMVRSVLQTACISAFETLTEGNMTSPESERTVAFLVEQLDASASSAQIAGLFIQVCQEIEAALVPIVGQRGVTALFARSLQLSAKSHAWLNPRAEGIPVLFDPRALREAISLQSGPEAAAGTCFLLQNFCDLLAKLVGRSLTERLLRAPWLIFLSNSGPLGFNNKQPSG
ncbi:hypothetical protein [Roseateles koreensis]|uniref:Uncharacterized protein n=1 Tax=Roseateles koreensis TaxID=2987526 RepID=A0ABT5KQK1_9BURK|nr:hypothetical protein [Roseateles koreensis]MDC8785189.1 hypothetical protein [Roseateles koreensis]